MALIIGWKDEWFVCRSTNADDSKRLIKCFDAANRVFLRASECEITEHPEYFRLPQHDEVELYREYMMISGREWLVQENSSKTGTDFIVAMRNYADEHGFLREMELCVKYKLRASIYAWLLDNAIPNVRMSITPIDKDLSTMSSREAGRMIGRYNLEQAAKEEADEESFKKLDIKK